MIRLRSRIAVSQPSDDTLVVQSNRSRRILFGSIGTVLLISFFVGFEPDAETSGMVAGTVFFFAVTAVCLAVAGWNSLMILDRSTRRASFVRRLFGIPLSRSEMELASVAAVVVQGARLLRDEEKPRATLISSRFRQHVERRNVYYKLMLETQEKLHFVEDSTDLSDLESVAQGIAEFLGVSYRHEEL